MSDLDAGVLAQKLGIGPERVEKALAEMGVPYSAPPAEPTEPGFYVTADRKWLLWLHSDGTGWGRTEIKGASNNRTSWTDGALWLTSDWPLVVRTLGDAAFPLMTLEEALGAMEALDDWCATEVGETLVGPELDHDYRMGRIDGINAVRRRLAGEDEGK